MRLIASLLALSALAFAPLAFAQPSTPPRVKPPTVTHNPAELAGRFQLELGGAQSGAVTNVEGNGERNDGVAPTIQNVPPNAAPPPVQGTRTPRPDTPPPRATIKDGRDD